MRGVDEHGNLAGTDPKDKRIAELEAHAEHDEDNLEGLEHALVRANQQYTQAAAALAEAKKRDVDAIPHMCQAVVFLKQAEAERDALLALMREARDDFHGKAVLFSSRYLDAVRQTP